MKRKILIIMFCVVFGLAAIVLVLANENTLVFHPKGVVAKDEMRLIITNVALMLVIILPTYLLLFSVLWRHITKKEEAEYKPEHTYGIKGEFLMWALPSVIVVILATITWEATHRLNPYNPLESESDDPLTVEVVALDWKWLFIYPEQGIATLNYLQIPEKTVIHFKLAADNTPMNSFWIPQLSGQIYSMTGMTTQLYLKADGIGDYTGRAVEINGEGYADMHFKVKSTSQKDFENWIAEAKKSSHHLKQKDYDELVKPFVDKSIVFFSEVDKDLFHKIVHKYMYPTKPVLWKIFSTEN